MEGEVIVEDIVFGLFRLVVVVFISLDFIMIGVEEKFVVVLRKDGGFENLEV